MLNRSKAIERYDPVEYSGVAADKNVRAPVASPKSSRFAQTLAYTNSARRGAIRVVRRRAEDGRALPAVTDRSPEALLPQLVGGAKSLPRSVTASWSDP